MKKQKLTIKSQQINKTFQKVPSFSYDKLKPSMFGMHNFKKNPPSKFCVVGTGSPDHESLAFQSYETFDEKILKKEGHIDRHGCSTQISGLISINSQEFKGLCPKSEMYFAKAFNKDGEGSYGGLAASILWGIICDVNCIILPCEVIDRYDGFYSIIKQAYRSNISIVAPISKSNNIRYDEILYVADDEKTIHGTVNMSERSKIYTTHLDDTYIKAHNIYYKLSATAGLIEIVKSDGIKSNENAYETMLSYFE